MKIIILIIGIFICSSGYGQDSVGFGQDRVWSLDTISYPSEEDVIKYSIQDNNTMIYLLLKYKEGCYNDSSYVCGYVYDSEFCESEEINPYNQNKLVLPNYEHKCIWTHKPPTFEGFIEWIEMQLNLK